MRAPPPLPPTPYRDLAVHSGEDGPLPRDFSLTRRHTWQFWPHRPC